MERNNNSDVVVFEVNKERYEVGDVEPTTTLLEFIRSRTPFKSAKLSCGEGGCGACVVLLSRYDPVHDQVESFNVSSCLTLLCSINGCSITTSEGLGNSKDGFHPIHKRFAGFHASQCGFCTPGMCMSFYSALVNAEKKNSKLTVPEAEKAIMGNLCRCTGYRPIADACKSFAADVDLEDLGVNCFWRKGEAKAGNLPAYNPKDHSCSQHQVAKDKDKLTRPLNSEKLSWYSPVTIEELQSLLYSSTDDTGARIKLVVGNTGNGYYKETERYNKYIDLRYIPELSVVKQENSEIEFGATLSISKVILHLRENSKANQLSGGDLVFTKIADHMEKVASGFIRNSGSLGGNLVMAQKKYFPSDIATVLLAAGSSVSLLTSNKHEKITVEEFLGRPPLDPKSVLLSVHIPFLEPASVDGSVKTSTRLLFETYRAAPRPHGNALPYLNAAFLADVSCDKSGILVNEIRLAFGAYGTKHATRAKKVEEFLGGKMLSVGVVNETMKLVKDAVVSEEGTPHAAYRSTLAVSFLFAFLNSFTSLGSATSNGSSEDLNGSLLEWIKISISGDENGNVSVSFEETCLEGADKINNGDNINPKSNLPLVSSAKQVVESRQDYYPVGEPMPKFGASIQASGEAVYVDDIPSPPNCLHGAFIYTTKPMARVKNISFKSNLQPSEVAAIVSAKDIPAEGENIGCIAPFASEALFADDISRCAGDLLAFVVADTQKKANMAAKMAVIDYDSKGLDPPILTVEEAVEKSSFFDVPPDDCPEKVGDFSKGMAEADHKIISAEIKLGAQYYFYMETQTALAIPDEDNCMVVYSSNQNPECAHSVIAKCLGVPEHNIRVITRRVGGGFGGKAMKSMHVAAACALAAHKLRRPVRVYVDRQTDMIVTGARHPMKITYSVGFKSNGQITALHLDILIDAGITEDISPLMPKLVIGSLKKYNWGALSFDIKVCKTNFSSRTAMRAPGDVQGSYIAEAIMEHVASFLSIEVDSVRSKNFHTYESLKLFHSSAYGESVEFTLPSIWDKIAKSSSFVQRTEAIEQFNSSNKWRKRGISRVPIVYEVFIKETPGKVSILKDGSIVVEVGGIELGQGLWTKVRQVTAYALSLIECEGTEKLIDKVRVVQADTLSIVQGGVTSGSTKSESSCAAVKLCCNVLVERLAPLKEKLQGQMGSVTWDVLILQAYDQNVNLAANSFYVPESSISRYLNYGAAVSEVEVNILTGETRILRTDLVYDCGQSLNPATDLGQIEGSFVQGIGFFMLEEYLTNSDGLLVSDSTWTYKIPTLDNIPQQFNVEVLNSGHHKNQILSSKASGEPPLLLAASVHCATRAAIKAARKQLKTWGAIEGTDSTFELDVPATLPVVKQLCGLNTVETYLQSLLSQSSG